MFALLPACVLSLIAAVPTQDDARRPVELAPADAGLDARLEQVLAREEYRYSLQGNVWTAPNRAHGLRSRVAATGLAVEPRSASAPGDATPWTLELGWTGWGREGQDLLPVERGTLRLEGERVVIARSQGVEWYENDERGIEQGFLLPVAPRCAPSDELLVLEFSTGREAALEVVSDGAQALVRDVRGELVARVGALHAFDATGRELDTAFACDGTHLRILVDDRGASYPLDIDPLITGPTWTFEGNQAGAWFGVAVATAGDVNGDGYSDVLVGAPYYDLGQVDEGAAFLFLGSAGGLSSSWSWRTESDQSTSGYGGAVAPAGDVNGDGFQDVLVSARSAIQVGGGTGKVWLYTGSAAGLFTTAAWTLAAGPDDGLLGLDVATAGDVNGDGLADVIVTVLSVDANPDNAGEARLFLGQPAPGSLGATPADTLVEPNGDVLHAGVGAGDVNGDGFDDVLIGTAYGTVNGWAGLYPGNSSGVASTALWQKYGTQANENFGGRLAGLGDVNGDGFADIAVGAHWASQFKGRVDVFHGSASGPATSASWSVFGTVIYEDLGSAVATAGDVNGDGYADLLAASEYSAKLYLGGSGGLAASSSWSSGGWFANGSSTATAGDVNGDGFSDVLTGDAKFDNGQTDEGKASLFLGGPKGLSTSAEWTRDSDQGSALFGAALAAIDLNSDGLSELVVGAPQFDNGQTDEGRVFVFLGSGTGPSEFAVWTAESNQAFALFGSSLAPAGDVNGDGYGDLIVGAPNFDNGETDEGRAYLYLGNSSALPTSGGDFDLDQASAYFGCSVDGAGDVNGDGFGDVIVGARGWDNGQANEGGAFVYLGSAGGLSTSPVWTGQSDQAGAYYGGSVAGAGDVNRDGRSDVIVGASLYDSPESNEGRAFVYLGNATGVNAAAVWTAESNQAGANFGSSVACAGDVNGDGRSDVLVGTPMYDNGHTDEGRASVYLGVSAGVAVVAAWNYESNQVGAWLGSRVAGAGDVDGDGRSDVAACAPGYDGGQTDEGAVFVYRGGTTTLYTTLETNQASSSLQAPVAGDFNGDGFSDLALGAQRHDSGSTDEGAVFVHLGNGRGPMRKPTQWYGDNVTPIAHLGASNLPTTFHMKMRGSSAAGRTRLRYEFEVKPWSATFNGVGVQWSNWALSSYPNFLGSFNDFTVAANGLAAATPYRWRARLATRSPFFPHTPWYSVQGATNQTKLRTSP